MFSVSKIVKDVGNREKEISIYVSFVNRPLTLDKQAGSRHQTHNYILHIHQDMDYRNTSPILSPQINPVR